MVDIHAPSAPESLSARASGDIAVSARANLSNQAMGMMEGGQLKSADISASKTVENGQIIFPNPYEGSGANKSGGGESTATGAIQSSAEQPNSAQKHGIQENLPASGSQLGEKKSGEKNGTVVSTEATAAEAAGASKTDRPNIIAANQPPGEAKPETHKVLVKHLGPAGGKS